MEKEVKLFDKRFVYFMWDEELEGETGFVADDIDDLQRFVEEGKDICRFLIFKCEGLNRFRRPFFASSASWRFAYYDPNYEVKKAYYKEGKKVQFFSDNKNKWIDIVGEPSWLGGTEYRVELEQETVDMSPYFKPKEDEGYECPCEDGIDSKACAGCPQDEWRKQIFRPFKDCDELIEFWSKNYQTALRPAQTKPLIWVRLKCDGRERLIVAFGKGFGSDFVEIGNKAKAVPLQKLFDDYEFLNGSPVGMEVKE